MKLFETFDPVKLQTLIDNFETLVIPRTDEHDKDKLNNYKQLLVKYINRSLDGEVVVNYHQKRDQGRYFANGSLSLQCLKRSVRHTIAQEYYQDIDIVNAHPIILEQLAKRYNIECPALTEYNNDRDKYLKMLDLPRDKAKRLYLILTNSDNCEIELTTQHLKEYSIEMQKLHREFTKRDEKEYEKFKKDREGTVMNNPKSSYVNSLLCDSENKILMAMYEYVGTPENAVLCFDGIMIKKGIQVDIKKCIKHVKDKTGFVVNLKIKEMDEGIDLTNIKASKVKNTKLEYFSDIRKFAGKEIAKEHLDKWVQCVSPIVHKSDFNFHITDKTSSYLTNYDAFVRTTSAFNVNVINPDFDPLFLKDNPRSKDIKARKYLFENLGYRKNGYLDHMVADGKLKTYFDVVFSPYIKSQNKTFPDHVCNMFRGFSHDNNLENVDTKLFTDSHFYNHMKVDFFRNDEGEFNHFLDFIADALQDPLNIKSTAHVFYSKQGTGKGALASFLKNLVDSENVIKFENSEMYFTKQFNGSSACKLFKIFEELKSSGSAFSNTDRLKAEISAPEERIELKRQNEYYVKHLSRYLFFTNNKNSIRVEADCRRLTMHHISDKHADNKTYFAPIWAEIEDKDYIQSAFKFFSTRKYNVRETYDSYVTQYKQEEKLSHLPNGIKFLIDYVTSLYDNHDTHITKHSWGILKDAYKEYCMSNGHKYTASTLETQLQKLELKKKRIKIDDKRVEGFIFSFKSIEETLAKYLKSPDYKIIDDGDEETPKTKPETPFKEIPEIVKVKAIPEFIKKSEESEESETEEESEKSETEEEEREEKPKIDIRNITSNTKKIKKRRKPKMTHKIKISF